MLRDGETSLGCFKKSGEQFRDLEVDRGSYVLIESRKFTVVER